MWAVNSGTRHLFTWWFSDKMLNFVRFTLGTFGCNCRCAIWVSLEGLQVATAKFASNADFNLMSILSSTWFQRNQICPEPLAEWWWLGWLMLALGWARFYIAIFFRNERLFLPNNRQPNFRRAQRCVIELIVNHLATKMPSWCFFRWNHLPRGSTLGHVVGHAATRRRRDQLMVDGDDWTQNHDPWWVPNHWLAILVDHWLIMLSYVDQPLIGEYMVNPNKNESKWKRNTNDDSAHPQWWSHDQWSAWPILVGCGDYPWFENDGPQNIVRFQFKHIRTYRYDSICILFNHCELLPRHLFGVILATAAIDWHCHLRCCCCWW